MSSSDERFIAPRRRAGESNTPIARAGSVDESDEIHRVRLNGPRVDAVAAAREEKAKRDIEELKTRERLALARLRGGDNDEEAALMCGLSEGEVTRIRLNGVWDGRYVERVEDGP